MRKTREQQLKDTDEAIKRWDRKLNRAFAALDRLRQKRKRLERLPAQRVVTSPSAQIKTPRIASGDAGRAFSFKDGGEA